MLKARAIECGETKTPPFISNFRVPLTSNDARPCSSLDSLADVFNVETDQGGAFLHKGELALGMRQYARGGGEDITRNVRNKCHRFVFTLQHVDTEDTP